MGLPWWLSDREYTCQWRRHGFDPWVEKIPWRRKWQPTLIFFLWNPMDRRTWPATVQVCICLLVAQSCPTLCDPMDCSLPGPSAHGNFRQEYWNLLLFSYLGNLPDPGIEPTYPALQADLLPSELPGKPSIPKGGCNRWCFPNSLGIEPSCRVL